MPYTPTNWQDGVTLGNQTLMNHLETQFSEAMKSNNQDLLAPYVMSGLVASRHNAYASTVLADAPLRYYRLDETSGTAVYDISGNGQNGTTNGSPTQNVAGALVGDPDTAYTFAAASSQTVSVPNGSLPTGNSAMSLECWFKFAANPAATQALIGYGHNPSAAHQDMYLYIDSSGRLNVDFQTGSAVTSAAVSTGAWHHAVATWDGTTLRLYLDGVSVGTPITPGAQAIPAGPVCNIAALATGGNDYSGQIDEVAIYGTALSSTRVSAHYTNGTTATTQVDMTSGTVYATQSDSTTRQRAISSTSFTTVTPSTTYYLYAQPDGTTYWNTANTPAANSLALAQVTTDGSGNVKLVTDMRTLVAKVLPNSAGGVSFPAIGGQATAGSFGAPVIVAQAIRTTITDTSLHTLISITLPAGTYRQSASVCIGNGTASNKPTFQTSFTDSRGIHDGNAFMAYTPTGMFPMDGTNAIFSAAYGSAAILTMCNDMNAGILTVTYQSTGTPNDVISYVLERLA